jgi:hypothetical protein
MGGNMWKKIINWLARNQILHIRVVLQKDLDDVRSKLIITRGHLSACIKNLDGRCPNEFLHDLQRAKDHVKTLEDL